MAANDLPYTVTVEKTTSFDFVMTATDPEGNYVEIKPLEWEDIIKGAIEYFNVKSNHHECEDMEYNEDESIDSTFTDESVINPN